MTSSDEFTQLHQRLDDLESRVRQKLREVEAAGAPSSADQAKIDDVRAKSASLREKLRQGRPNSWPAMKHELETEWHALSHAFEHWAEHVDRHYRKRNE